MAKKKSPAHAKQLMRGPDSLLNKLLNITLVRLPLLCIVSYILCIFLILILFSRTFWSRLSVSIRGRGNKLGAFGIQQMF